MTSIKKAILFPVILLELAIITGIVFNIIKQINSEKVTVAPLSASDYQISGFDDLKYFYEPRPGISYDSPPDNPSHKVGHLINSDTTKSRKEYPLEKPKDVFRVETLGDSFTYGVFVEDDKAWPSVLETLLNSENSCKNYHRFEIINLGVSGYDTTYSAQRFIKRDLKYSPDLLIWLHTGFKKVDEFYVPLKYEYREKLGVSNIPLEVKREFIDGIVKRLGMEKIISYQETAFRKVFDNFTKRILNVDMKGHYATSRETDILKNFTKSYPNVYWAEIRSIREPGLYFENDGHPTEEGHRIIAEDIFNYLIKNKIIDCKIN